MAGRVLERGAAAVVPGLGERVAARRFSGDRAGAASGVRESAAPVEGDRRAQGESAAADAAFGSAPAAALRGRGESVEADAAFGSAPAAALTGRGEGTAAAPAREGDAAAAAAAGRGDAAGERKLEAGLRRSDRGDIVVMEPPGDRDAEDWRRREGDAAGLQDSSGSQALLRRLGLFWGDASEAYCQERGDASEGVHQDRGDASEAVCQEWKGVDGVQRCDASWGGGRHVHRTTCGRWD